MFNERDHAYEVAIHDAGKRAYSGNGINVNLMSFINWNRRLDRNELLNKTNRSLMWSRYPYANKKDQFLYGWGTYKTNDLNSVGFSGSGVCAYRKYLDNDFSIIFLSNGFKGRPVHNEIVDEIGKMVVAHFN